MKEKTKRNIGRIVLSTLVLVLLFELYVWCRLCLFTSCVIPTDSMKPIILPGDYLFVPLTTKIKRNDICVFEYPYSRGKDRMRPNGNVFYCKRCVGIPGDTFFIDRQGLYHILGYNEVVGNREMQQIIGKIPVRYDSIYIPRSGDRVRMDSITCRLYKTCIEYETGDTLSCRRDSAFLTHIYLEEYKFRKNYYYMAGDNVADSRDSRYWGLLPEDFVLGYAGFVWYSRDKESGKVRWERIFHGFR